MTIVRVRPGVLRGAARAPPSKSYTHRALIAGHLARRRSVVEHPLDADDTRATARALTALGSRIRFARDRWVLEPDRAPRRRSVVIDCGESGTTLRFVAALAANSAVPVRLEGRGRLPERPIGTLYDALEALGASVERPSGGRGLPATLEGPLHGGRLRLDASESSQFASALLLVLPTLPEDSEIELVGPIVSEPYLEATLSVLTRQGVRVRRRGRRLRIPGRQRYRGGRFPVPGDASSAAYFWVAAAISGGRVRISGIPTSLPQADLAVLDLLRSVGTSVERSERGTAVEGRPRRGFTVDLTSAPDLYPLAGVIAAVIPAESHLSGAAHVALKESDRSAGTALLARALGADVREERGGLRVRGTAHPTRFDLANFDDHRLVMSAAVGALAADGPCRIGDARSVSKSFPRFWTMLGSLRARERA